VFWVFNSVVTPINKPVSIHGDDMEKAVTDGHGHRFG